MDAACDRLPDLWRDRRLQAVSLSRAQQRLIFMPGQDRMLRRAVGVP
jgi:hypothetical protein